ncbi:sulfatase family protein [Stieleria varia]|uniref:Arylsulfatase n=1 Tax=Stieleria varia TaxID=2528005 RepID=A0A5C6BA27_9BACT|nr:sulfatase-like hydrolase/transferase [Stieleria varia]TWU08116.1 Arylsulfatase [Stieleria varia]
MNRIASGLTLCLIVTSLASAKSPNVVLVMCDDLGIGDPQCFNPKSPIATPNIDAMAAAGLKFTRFYAAAPVCSPTRGSCLTGRHPFRYGVYFANTGHLKTDEITLPELLREQGYKTGHFGKWHLGTLTTTIKDANRGGPKNKQHFAPPRDHGYDESFVTESKVPTFDPMIQPAKPDEKAWDAIVDPSSAQPYGTHYWDHAGNPVTENLDGDDSRIIMDRAIPFIEDAAKSQQPFFAAIWFHAPHLPVVAGEKHVAMYRDHDVYERNYYGCVTAMDEQVGRLREKLRELGVAQDTMLWFCSDNGPEGQQGKAPGSADDFRGRKRSLYEGGVRVPGILEWPSRVKPGVTDVAAVTSDYLPTMLDALEIKYPDDRPIDGMSLLPVIDGKVSQREKPIGFQSNKQIAWHDGVWKLYSGDDGKNWELYDLSSDPCEQRECSGERPEDVERMAAAVQQWRESCKRSDGGGDY